MNPNAAYLPIAYTLTQSKAHVKLLRNYSTWYICMQKREIIYIYIYILPRFHQGRRRVCVKNRLAFALCATGKAQGFEISN